MVMVIFLRTFLRPDVCVVLKALLSAMSRLVGRLRRSEQLIVKKQNTQPGAGDVSSNRVMVLNLTPGTSRNFRLTVILAGRAAFRTSLWANPFTERVNG